MAGDFLDDDPAPATGGFLDTVEDGLSGLGEGLVLLFGGVTLILVLVIIVLHEADRVA